MRTSSSLENTTHQEMTSMAQQLQILNSELHAAQQEDEGATYRIEELERYRTMSNEMATHLEFKSPWIDPIWNGRTRVHYGMEEPGSFH